MKFRLKPLNEQVMVITGASSGIGLTTARMAAEKGAKLVVAGRSEDALRQLADEINGKGGQAVHVVADVGNEADVRRIAEAAISRFGGFDTWFNNAGVGLYGRIEEVSLDDMRRLFDTNFWGVVHGSKIAVEHLKQRGGVLINMGSVVSDRAIPLQGVYSASKQAIKGFTDALRMELEEAGAPVVVTLIKPGSIDTPYVRNARSYMEQEPDFPPPVYAPEVVARAVLHCATRPERDVIIGGGGKIMSSMANTPRLGDRYMRATLFGQQRADRPNDGRDALYEPSNALSERGGYGGHVARTSLYTSASLHPILTTAALLGAGAAVAAVVTGGAAEAARAATRTVTRAVAPTRDWLDDD